MLSATVFVLEAVRIETRPVVFADQPQLVLGLPDDDAGGRRAGMLQHVGQGLLQHAIADDFDLGLEPRLVGDRAMKIDGDSRARGPRLDAPPLQRCAPANPAS